MVVFIVQVAASLIFSDLDLDLESDFGFGDLISLKGLLHFIIGASTTCVVIGESLSKGWTHLIAAGVGVLFTFILGFLYKYLYKHLKQERTYIMEFNMSVGTIDFWDSKSNRGEISCVIDNEFLRLTVTSDIQLELKSGDQVCFSGTRSGVKVIHKV
jgi:hypothetical protein